MRATTRTLLLAIFGATAYPAPAAAQPADDALREQVRAAWAQRQGAVRSLRAEWTTKSTTPKGAMSFLPRRPDSKLPPIIPERDTVHDGDAELLLDGAKTRVTMRGTWLDGDKGEFLRSQITSTYDGEKFTLLKGPEHLGHATAATKATDHNMLGDDVAVAPMLTSTRGLVPPVARFALESYTQARYVTTDGRRLALLTRPRNETQGEASLWLDPAQDYAPVRSETYDREGKLMSRLTAVNSRPAGDVACWLPERWTAVIWMPAGKLFRQVEVVVRRREVNVATAAADFALALPAGTYLTEEGDKKAEHSIIRDDGSKRPILPSERDVTYDELVRTEPGKSPWAVWTWVWWACGAGGVLCAGSVALLLRRRPRPASG